MTTTTAKIDKSVTSIKKKVASHRTALYEALEGCYWLFIEYSNSPQELYRYALSKGDGVYVKAAENNAFLKDNERTTTKIITLIVDLCFYESLEDGSVNDKSNRSKRVNALLNILEDKWDDFEQGEVAGFIKDFEYNELKGIEALLAWGRDKDEEDEADLDTNDNISAIEDDDDDYDDEDYIDPYIEVTESRVFRKKEIIPNIPLPQELLDATPNIKGTEKKIVVLLAEVNDGETIVKNYINDAELIKSVVYMATE
jgi:hypothetical protein